MCCVWQVSSRARACREAQIYGRRAYWCSRLLARTTGEPPVASCVCVRVCVLVGAHTAPRALTRTTGGACALYFQAHACVFLAVFVVVFVCVRVCVRPCVCVLCGCVCMCMAQSNWSHVIGLCTALRRPLGFALGRTWVRQRRGVADWPQDQAERVLARQLLLPVPVETQLASSTLSSCCTVWYLLCTCHCWLRTWRRPLAIATTAGAEQALPTCCELVAAAAMPVRHVGTV